MRPWVWGAEAVERARALWVEGLSTGLIAVELGVTKNALIGAAHRHGFPPRPNPIRGASPNEPLSHSDAIQPNEPLGSSERAGPVRMSHSDAMAHRAEPPKPKAPPRAPPRIVLEGCACQWPSGEEPPFIWCDAPRLMGRPYCPEHDALAYGRAGAVHA